MVDPIWQMLVDDDVVIVSPPTHFGQGPSSKTMARSNVIMPLIVGEELWWFARSLGQRTDRDQTVSPIPATSLEAATVIKVPCAAADGS